MKLFEKDKRMKVQSSYSKNKLLEACKALEDFMKQFIKSLDDAPSSKLGTQKTQYNSLVNVAHGFR